MTELQLANIRSDLSRYLHKRNTLTSPELSAVITDVNVFSLLVIRHGFDAALIELPSFVRGLPERRFLEVSQIIVEHHLRLVHKLDRDVLRKSLLEVYIHTAGPQSVLTRYKQTPFERSLRRSGSRGFVAQFLSLHVFNVVSLASQDLVRRKMLDVESFELYMLGVEMICRDTVKAAIEAARAKVDRSWADFVTKNIEAQLLHLQPMRSPAYSIVDGNDK